MPLVVMVPCGVDAEVDESNCAWAWAWPCAREDVAPSADSGFSPASSSMAALARWALLRSRSRRRPRRRRWWPPSSIHSSSANSSMSSSTSSSSSSSRSSPFDSSIRARGLSGRDFTWRTWPRRGDDRSSISPPRPFVLCVNRASAPSSSMSVALSHGEAAATSEKPARSTSSESTVVLLGGVVVACAPRGGGIGRGADLGLSDTPP